MTRRGKSVWQDDPPFAVGEALSAPATDEEIIGRMKRPHELSDFEQALIARIKAEREQTIRELRDNYKCGDEYEAGLWSRRNIEAFFRDQDKET